MLSPSPRISHSVPNAAARRRQFRLPFAGLLCDMAIADLRLSCFDAESKGYERSPWRSEGEGAASPFILVPGPFSPRPLFLGRSAPFSLAV